ncbi:flagellar basal body P-ring protein FlgI [Leptospira sp. 85282-16]|uniref:Flagellar P-ring protein n=1 Tax=Leptospira montravelensis TaxID=2484961 RepID=A0ABY2LYL0_9LEPT|nr:MULTISPECIES: flagellar basal body P-ring protein FlgI [Leptospira]MCT8332708.1 flagellar basal body P-ring protein FlgI [Leptospira sp. 85282-16]TGK83913.1 flagellar basal body P-ring protein FlgI [Leptospira montravelensis]TGL05920.1 flagellar basal body P-ring protein FlgI [Leptospira montravelensis]
MPILKENRSSNQELKIEIFRFFANPFVALAIFLFATLPSFAVETRLKDLVRIDAVRENQLTGFGLVVGLNGTGDTKNPLTEEALQNYLAGLGVNTKKNLRDAKNTASVLITANVPVNLKEGDKIDVLVSSLGDARSLEGGVLLQSPLKAGNGETIAVASGVLAFGGKEKKRGGADKKSGSNTALVPMGAILEKSVPNAPVTKSVKLTLLEKDYTTMGAIVDVITAELQVTPEVVSPTEVLVPLPLKTSGQTSTGEMATGEPKLDLAFLSRLENLTVNSSPVARVVINERTGTIVMGANIPIDEVAISQQGLTIQIANRDKARYFFPIQEEGKGESVFVLKETTQVSDVVGALNKVGASTRDIISILEALKKQGALKAELVIQ